MRDLLIIGIFLGALPFALRHVWAGVLLWTWFSLMNPHRLAYGFAATAPFALLAALATFVAILVDKRKIRLPGSAPVVLLAVMVMWMCLTTAVAFHPNGSLDQLIKVLKIQVMTFVALAALQERKHIEYFIWVNVLALGFYGLKGGVFTLLTGGAERVWGPSGTYIQGNNELALALVVAIPLMNYLRVVATRRSIRLGLLALMLLSAVAVAGSQSRGAFLAIVAMGGVLWLRSSRKFVSMMGLLTCALALVAFMPEKWEARISSIGSYEQDESAMGRIDAWKLTTRIAGSRLTGGGFDIYTPDIYAIFNPEAKRVLVAHSVYFSMLGEHGYPGLALFLAVWAATWLLAGRLRKRTRDDPELHWVHHLAGMCQVAMAGYLVGGAFLSLAYFDLPYNVLVIVVTVSAWVKAERWKTERSGAFGSAMAARNRLAAAGA